MLSILKSLKFVIFERENMVLCPLPPQLTNAFQIRLE